MALALFRGSLRLARCRQVSWACRLAASGPLETGPPTYSVDQQPDLSENVIKWLGDSSFASRLSFHTSRPASEATTSGGDSASAAQLEEKRRGINKILYRSRQRGLLELDLLIGKWAADNVPNMDAEAMQNYTQILDEENPDLWKWLTEQAEAPADLKENPVFESLCNYVRKDLEAKADPATRTEPGRAWVRGWNDSDRKVGGPPGGNQ